MTAQGRHRRAHRARPVTDYTPHPYALLLPALTDDEYGALKADIAENGILYPIIVDEDGEVLDGVHRSFLASELGIDLSVSRHTWLSNARKMHLAIGLNKRCPYGLTRLRRPFGHNIAQYKEIQR